MHKEYYYDSCGEGKICAYVWKPRKKPKAILQIVHGVAESCRRYHDFAQHLTDGGYLVVAEDHMGHGKSCGAGETPAYFHGGWFCAVEDTYQLFCQTRECYPEIPYIIFGHSMGSFMARSLLIKYSNMDIAGCILCATGWFPDKAVQTAARIVEKSRRLFDDRKVNPRLQKLFFGAFNRRIKDPRTPYDWTNRDSAAVDLAIAEHLENFCVTNGLAQDLLVGISYIQDRDKLMHMHKETPILLIAGSDDPVGWYGDGVLKTAERLRSAGMRDVKIKIYPQCRHELLHEQNKCEIITDIDNWLKLYIPE